jgi:hypothetical protein
MFVIPMFVMVSPVDMVSDMQSVRCIVTECVELPCGDRVSALCSLWLAFLTLKTKKIETCEMPVVSVGTTFQLLT